MRFLFKEAGTHDRHIWGRPVGLLIIIFYKALSGLIEIFTGLLFFFSVSVIANELAEDPQDVFLNWLLSQPHFNYKGLVHLGIFIATLGMVKLILAVCLWYRSWPMRKILIIFFTAAVIFGIYYLYFAFSLWKIPALLFEFFILYYLWKILPRHLNESTSLP